MSDEPFLLLQHVERTRMPLDEHAPDAAWLDLNRFLFDPDVTDQWTLRAMAQHAFFCDDPESRRSPGLRGTRHGPYRIECLGPDAYDISDRLSAEETLHRWAETSSASAERRYPPAIHTAEQILAAASTIFELRELPETCAHDFGHALDDFHEFVLLNRHDGILTVLVAATTRAPRPSA
jgi:hypothetical protein